MNISSFSPPFSFSGSLEGGREFRAHFFVERGSDITVNSFLFFVNSISEMCEIAILVLPYLELKDLLVFGQVCRLLRTITFKTDFWKGLFPPWYGYPVEQPDKLDFIKLLRKPFEWANHSLVVDTLWENECMRLMTNNKYFVGARGGGGLHQYVAKPSSQGYAELLTETNMKAYTMDNYYHLLAVGAKSRHIYFIDTLYGGIVGSMEVIPQLPAYQRVSNCSTSIYKPISQVKFTKNGRYLFSSSPGLLNGVSMWDVETCQEIQVFNHHLNKTWELGPWREKSKHEIYGVCPTAKGDQFVSTSFSRFYHWDTRSGEIVSTHKFYEEERISELSQIYFINNDSEILIYGRNPAKMTLYSFASLTPSFQQFDSAKLHDFSAMYFKEFYGIGCSKAGLSVFNCVTKELQSISLPLPLSGREAVCCHINDAGDSMGISFRGRKGMEHAPLATFSSKDLGYRKRSGIFTPKQYQKNKCVVQ